MLVWTGLKTRPRCPDALPGIPSNDVDDDLDNDLGETTNDATDHPELVDRAEELFKEQHVPNPLWNAPFKPRKR